MKIKIGNGAGAGNIKKVFVIYTWLPGDLGKFEAGIKFDKEPSEIYMSANTAAGKRIGARRFIIGMVIIYTGYLVIAGVRRIACIPKSGFAIDEIFRIAFA